MNLKMIKTDEGRYSKKLVSSSCCDVWGAKQIHLMVYASQYFLKQPSRVVPNDYWFYVD